MTRELGTNTIELSARCSVVAAANPIYGRFDNSLPLVRNVSLPDSLLSRFDLVFIIRDTVNKETDRKLADHVLRMHYLRGVMPQTPQLPVRYREFSLFACTCASRRPPG